MPLVGSDAKLGQDMYTLARQAMGPSPNPESDAQLQKLCTSFATAIINHLLAFGQVGAGIPTAGSPAAQSTILPGKFI